MHTSVLQACDEEKLLGHLGVVLYEYLGEEYPDVLGSILGALKAIVNVIGMTVRAVAAHLPPELFALSRWAFASRTSCIMQPYGKSITGTCGSAASRYGRLASAFRHSQAGLTGVRHTFRWLHRDSCCRCIC
jgi:hypothetical protein